MAADAQTDLFTFGLANKKPLKEQVTPHKLALLVLIHEYSVIKKAENLAPNMFALDEREPVVTFTETEKRNFMINILQLLQSQDLKLKELSVRIQDNLNIQLYETFCDRLHDFYEEGIRVIQDFFQNLSFLLIQEGLIELCISKFSVLGVFLRRMILAFEKLTFSQVIKLHAKFVDYYSEGRNEQVPEESNIFGGSLTDTALSLSEVRFNKSGLAHSMDALRRTDWKSSQVPSGFFSQKQAEYFIAQQGMLLQHNENEALSPQVLQERIMDILKARPDIAEAEIIMAADAQTDLFTFGLANKKPLKEQVTPHKLALLVLIHEYSVIKKAENLAPNMFALDEREPVVTFTETEKRNFMITILQLLQSQDLKLKELSVRIQDNLNIQLYETFCDRLHDFYEEGIRVIQDFFQNLSFLLIQEGLIELCISKFSVLGVFLRRMILAFEKLTFSQVIKLHAKFVDYYSEGRNEQVPEESNIFGGSLTDTALSLSEVRFNKSGLAHSMDALRHTDWKSSQVPSGFFSQKQAEYFIAQQGMLLQHNENEALSPQVLQERIMDILKARPDIAEAHFLSYLNSLRVKEYCTAVHNLYHYFDRNMSLMETNSANKGREEDVCRRYAALNLALLHYRFGHKKESKAALHEAIRLAQGTNDHVCLQHALSWLYRLEEQGSAKTANLMERAVTKSSELSLPNLTSLGVQSLAKHNAFAGAKPSSVFEYIMKSDILNCQHSQSGFMCMSYTQKAALWKMYGKRECHAMTSQLVLNLDTSESCVYHNGEPVCIALCNMAKLHADNGQYTLAFDIINNSKLRFPPHTQYAYLWMSCEQEILFDRTLLNRKWSITEQAIVNLKALNEPEAELRNAILCKEKGDVTSALSQLNKLLEKLNKADTEVSPDFKCRVLITLGELYSQSGNTTVAINYILECITKSRQHYLQQMEAIASAHLAYAQLQMQLPEQALKLLDQHMLTILSHGSVYDKARVLYCHARCQVAMGAKSTKADKKSALLAAVNMLDRVVDMFRTVEAFMRVKDGLYYQARLYNELNYTAERNKCAYQFKQLDQQYPTLNKACVNVL